MGWDGIYKAFRVVKVLFYKFVYVYVGDVSVFFLQWVTFKHKFESTNL